MRKFDTKVQYLKYKVLREVAHQAWEFIWSDIRSSGYADRRIFSKVDELVEDFSVVAALG